MLATSSLGCFRPVRAASGADGGLADLRWRDRRRLRRQISASRRTLPAEVGRVLIPDRTVRTFAGMRLRPSMTGPGEDTTVETLAGSTGSCSLPTRCWTPGPPLSAGRRRCRPNLPGCHRLIPETGPPTRAGSATALGTRSPYYSPGRGGPASRRQRRTIPLSGGLQGPEPLTLHMLHSTGRRRSGEPTAAAAVVLSRRRSARVDQRSGRHLRRADPGHCALQQQFRARQQGGCTGALGNGARLGR